MMAALFFSFLGYCLFFSRRLRCPVECLPFLVVSLLIAALYLCAFMSFLLPGACVIALGGFVCFALFFLGKEVRSSLTRFFSPSMVLFLCCSVLVWMRFRDCVYSDWDEFAIWGHMVKYMLAGEGFVGADATMKFRDYPPGAALFQYYLCRFSGFTEGTTYVAMNFMCLCAFTVYQSRISWKNWPLSLLMLAASVLAVLAWGRTFDTIYADHLLGIWFGTAIALYFISSASPNEALLCAIPALFVIPLVKPIGIYLAFISCLVIVLDCLLRSLSEGFSLKERLFRFLSPENRRRSVLTLFLVLSLFLSVLISGGLWKARLYAEGVKESWSASITLPAVMKSLSPAHQSPREERIIRHYYDTLYNSDLSYLGGVSKYVRLTPRKGVVMILMLALLGGLLCDKGRMRIAGSQILLFLGWSGYMLLLLVLLYLNFFDDYESARLASFARYAATYYIGWNLMVLSFYHGIMVEGIGRKRFWALSIVVFFICAFCDVHQYKAPEELMGFRADAKKMVSSIKRAIPQGDSVYIIWQNSPGAPRVVLSYELAPHRSNYEGWSLGTPYGDDDIWTRNWTGEQWEKELVNYDYLFMGHGDEQFWHFYGGIFEDPARSRKCSLFRVIHGESGRVRLRIVE